MKKFEIKDSYFIKKIDGKIHRFVLIGDIHFSSIVPDKFLNRLSKKVDELKPEVILIAGDLIDSTNEIKSPEEKSRLFSFLKNLGEIAQVIICLGNHDLSAVVKHKHVDDYNPELYKEINKIKNVKILDNEYFSCGNINVYGFTKTIDNYADERKKTTVNGEISSKYKVLLTHSPINLETSNFDLVLTGHMHNGLVFKLIDKLIKGNWGFVGPNGKLFPKFARGIYTQDKTVTIITGGITKFSKKAPKVTHILNNLYPISINVIEIKA